MRVEELFSVNEKVVLITGGSRGIGEMIASGFSKWSQSLCHIKKRKRNFETANRLKTYYMDW